ncbi:MAG: CoA pyrophosphatase [Desulfotignum sp.]|nr:CoA pyrophosphatase [Desulfotignum sp.]MCF8112448.1 CoA pyrophosphatase [Desulfotignum sp.]MCF8124823.1 CoA pyrophosphatase [Desulfotignum sp.]
MDKTRCRQKIITALGCAVNPSLPDPDRFDPTAVMVLFLFNQKTPELLFIQKADVAGYPWRNQMAFPGGHVDKTDAHPLETALRELKEELGIHPDNVEVIGSIGHFQTINDKDIQAFAGIWNQQDAIRPDPAEIGRILQIPVDHLITLHQEKRYIGKKLSVMDLTYPFEDVVIWGVTAKILHHLLELLIQP